MSVAYLIVAHSPNPQLRLLVERLLHDPRGWVYVHLDRKTSDTRWLGGFAHPRFRWIQAHAVHWASYSVVRAILALLETAVAEPRHTEFVLLSGACFPLLPPGRLEDAIVARGSEFAIWGKLDRDSRIDHYGVRAVTKFYPYGIGWLNPKRGLLQRLWWRAFRILNARAPYARSLPELPLWKGSMFFLADRPLAERLIAQAPQLEPLLRFAHAPDEILFATVYARDRSERGLVVTETAVNAERQGTHFIPRRVAVRRALQWLRPPADDRRIEPDNIDAAMRSGALFARKCDLATAQRISQHSDA